MRALDAKSQLIFGRKSIMVQLKIQTNFVNLKFQLAGPSLSDCLESGGLKSGLAVKGIVKCVSDGDDLTNACLTLMSAGVIWGFVTSQFGLLFKFSRIFSYCS